MRKINFCLIFIMLIVMFGTIIRNYNTENKGLFFYDEGIYVCSAKAKYLNLINKFGIKEKITEKDAVLKQHIGKISPNFITGSKIGFVFFIFLSFFLFGINAYSPLLVSVFFGALTILLVYLIARRVYNENIALLSAVVLAVSSMHIMYSRCALPQAASIFFLFLAFYFYVVFLGNKKYIYAILCALTVGLAFTVHYNLLLMLPLFVFFEAFRLFFIDKNESKKFMKIAAFSAAVILPVIFWQAVTVIDQIYKLGFYPVTYFGELKTSFTAIAGQTKNKIDPFFSLFYFQKMEGWIVFIFFIFGVISLIKKLRKNFNMAEFVLLVLALFPIVWYGFYPHLRVLRSFSPVLPAMAIIVSYKIITFCFWEKIKPFGRFLAPVLTLAVIIMGVTGFRPIIELKSCYGDVVKYLYENKVGAKGPSPLLLSYVDEMYPVFAYYMGGDVVAINKLDDVGAYGRTPLLVNIFTYNKALAGVTPYKVFKQVSFSAHNAEGGSKDKYVTKNIPTQDVCLYRK